MISSAPKSLKTVDGSEPDRRGTTVRDIKKWPPTFGKNKQKQTKFFLHELNVRFFSTVPAWYKVGFHMLFRHSMILNVQLFQQRLQTLGHVPFWCNFCSLQVVATNDIQF